MAVPEDRPVVQPNLYGALPDGGVGSESNRNPSSLPLAVKRQHRLGGCFSTAAVTHSRRFCSIECGNRLRVRRYYARMTRTKRTG